MFKKTIISAVLLAAAVGVAQAQTQPTQSPLQIYGNLDVGVVNAGKVGARNGNATMFLNGAMDTSRVGLVTTESLGGGRSAGVHLEGQIMPGDGSQGLTSGAGAANAVFGREAKVFFSDESWGRVLAGRQLSASYQAFSAGDTRGGKNFGSSAIFFADGSSFGGTSTAKTGLGTLTGSTYLSNSVRYETPKFGPVRAIVQRQFGGVASDSSLGDVNASTSTHLALHYNQGPFNGAVGYRSGTSATGVTTSRHYSVGGTYDINNKWRAGLGYTAIDNPNGANAVNTKFDFKVVSARYNISDNLWLTSGHYMLKDKVTTTNGANMTSLVADYSLSKRTGAYVGFAQVANRGSSGIAPYGGGGANLNSLAGSTAYPSLMTVAGQTQRALVVGMNHRF
jgi:predicted porin